MPPDPRNAVAARLQIPFAQLFDITIRFLSEQMRSHTSSQHSTARFHIVRCSRCVSPRALVTNVPLSVSPLMDGFGVNLTAAG